MMAGRFTRYIRGQMAERMVSAQTLAAYLRISRDTLYRRFRDGLWTLPQVEMIFRLFETPDSIRAKMTEWKQ